MTLPGPEKTFPPACICKFLVVKERESRYIPYTNGNMEFVIIIIRNVGIDLLTLPSKITRC